MSLETGARLGPYEILSVLGVGGMGEVYRARDTKLNRDVAIKVLPEGFAADPDRVARFKREAQVLAALNHPNIAHIHGFEDADGIHALILELVDGPTLAEMIAGSRLQASGSGPASRSEVQSPKPKGGGLPLHDALNIARQLAEALEAAHEQGIVHRDLKPANIKVRDDGTVKVLDFGLAKVLEPGEAGRGAETRRAGGLVELSQSPTFTSPAMLTDVGVILGTAAYMSPEQAKGRPADKRSDVWAFGAVFYEMLTGRRAFEGEDLSDTLANVLKSEPDWSALPADVPSHVRTLVRRCLTKDRRQRMADMSVALFVMAEAASLAPAAALTGGQPAMPVRSPLWRRLVLPTAAAIVAGATVGAAVWLGTRPSVPRITRFALDPTGVAALSVDTVSIDLAITPDGSQILYKGRTTGAQLFVRALDRLEPTRLTGPDARAPFPSPDGQWIGFVDAPAQMLRKVSVTGGPAQPLGPIDGQSRGATWGDDGSIIFATNEPSTGLQRVSSDGGAPTVLTKPNRERGEGDHFWPKFLPGGQAVLFTITATTGGLDASQVAVLDLRTGKQSVLVHGGSQAQYLPSGHLVYEAGGALRVVAFDLQRLAPIGTSIAVVPQVVTLPTGTAEFDVARNGTLVYISGGAGATPPRTLVWVDRQGHEDPIKAAPIRSYVAPRLSPDGKRVALQISDQENDIWVWDGRALVKVTRDPGLDSGPAWMPDGLRLVFSSQAGSVVGSLFWQAADGTGAAQSLTQSANRQVPSAVFSDAGGTHVLFSQGLGAAIDLMVLTLENGNREEPLLRTASAERNGEISPDRRWLAYQSDESGQFEISVRPFPDVTKQKFPVSTGGGSQPLWARNGQELFYLAPNGALRSVRVEAGATWKASTPTKVFEGPYYYGGGATNISRTYDVSLDGQRFLMIKEGGGPEQTPAPQSIVVVENWFEELKRLVPTK